MNEDIDLKYMQRALSLAQKGRYTTSPNPCVGCVLVKDNLIVGEGYHVKAGEPHAERNALANAGDVRGGTAYVTLEPCSHYGRTPPCADGLIESGVERVVVAMQDPNPQVAGTGIKKLQQAGIEVNVGLLEQEARALNKGFIQRMTQNKPYVSIKLAASLDGRTAMASGESKWITGPEARADVQKMRASSCAVLTGIGTIMADDPSLNVRLSMVDLESDLAAESVRQPLRVVLDTQLSIPATSKILTHVGDTLIITCSNNVERKAAIESMGGEVLVLGTTTIDLSDVLDILAQRQINQLMVEAGSTLAAAFLEQGLLDELVLYQAPSIMGDMAKGLFHLPELTHMKDKIKLQFSEIERVGEDLKIIAQVER